MEEPGAKEAAVGLWQHRFPRSLESHVGKGASCCASEHGAAAVGTASDSAVLAAPAWRVGRGQSAWRCVLGQHRPQE